MELRPAQADLDMESPLFALDEESGEDDDDDDENNNNETNVERGSGI